MSAGNPPREPSEARVLKDVKLESVSVNSEPSVFGGTLEVTDEAQLRAEVETLRAEAVLEAETPDPDLQSALDAAEAASAPALVCPVCGLGACGHNLPYVPEEA